MLLLMERYSLPLAPSQREGDVIFISLFIACLRKLRRDGYAKASA